MNLQEALDIMKINSSLSELSTDTLKKKYHKLALIYHPDKNGNSIEAKEKFQQLGEAYELIQKELNIINHFDNKFSYNSEEPTTNDNNGGYSFFLNIFLETIITGQYSESIQSIIRDIVGGCKEVSLKMFDKMDRETSLYVYNFIMCNKIIDVYTLFVDYMSS